MRHIKLFDTTLRDGEQSPGCSMNQAEKVSVAQQLERLNVDIIEAGFAIASPGDFESIRAISRAVHTPIICSLARAIDRDIHAAADALRDAKKKRIHTFIATSDIHMRDKLNLSPAAVIDRAIASVKLAKSYTDDVEFSCEDAGRSDPDFLVKIIKAAIAAGATTINIPDTVGYQLPDTFGELVRYVIHHVNASDSVDFSVHCHDDLGLATANALAGVANGATQIECTINGIGERAGNTALEEVAMALSVRQDHYHVRTQIKQVEIMRTSKLVSRITGSVVPPNKAIVGDNAFAHEAGIHQDGVLKNPETYEIMKATDIGRDAATLVLGKHSGRHAFSDALNRLSIVISDDDLDRAFLRFKHICDTKKTVSDSDLEAIVRDETHEFNATIQLESVHSVSGESKPTATVSLYTGNQLLSGTETGVGSVNAIYNAIDSILNEKINLIDYRIQAVTAGIDALADVTVRLSEDNKIAVGRAADLDVLQASAKAYIQAINTIRSNRTN